MFSATAAGTPGSDTGGVTIATANAAGTRITGLYCSSNDTAAINLLVYILDGATVIPLGLVNVPIGSGTTAGVYNVDMMDPTVGLRGLPIDNNGRPYIDLKGSAVLKAVPLANMTAAKTAWVSWTGADAA